MINEWKEAPLSALADLSGGFAFKSGDYAPNGRFVLRTLNINEDSSINKDNAVYLPEVLCPQYNRFELKPQDTLFVMVGATLGKIGFVRESNLPALLNQNMWLIRARPGKADPRFLHYAFRYAAKESLGWASGSARDFVRRDDYRNLKIPAPSLFEQRTIANILGTLDDKIEINRRMNETLESMAQALFKSWFVDFDPVRAKSSVSGHLSVFPEQFQQSGIGEIPSGWGIRSLYDCAEYTNGLAFRNEQFSSDRTGLPVIKIGELKSGIAAQTKFTTSLFDQKYYVTAGDILFSWSGSPDTSIDTFIWAGSAGWLNQHIFKVSFKRPIEKLFVYYLLRHFKPVFIEIARNKQTTGLGHVTAQDLKRLATVFPPDSVLDRFKDLVMPVFSRAFVNIMESQTLASIRDSLLPKLLSGEIRVKEAEKLVGAAV